MSVFVEGKPAGGAQRGEALEPLSIAGRTCTSRLFVGTGKYATMELMRDALDAIPEDTPAKEARLAAMTAEENAGRSPQAYAEQSRWIGDLPPRVQTTLLAQFTNQVVDVEARFVGVRENACDQLAQPPRFFVQGLRRRPARRRPGCRAD